VCPSHILLQTMTWYEIPWELSENGSIKQHFRQFYKSIKASLCVPQPWCQISLPTHYQKLHMVEYHMQLRAEGALFLFVHQIICINISWHVNTISNINVLVCLAKQVKCLRGPSFRISFFPPMQDVLVWATIKHSICTSEKTSCQLTSPIKPPLVLSCLFPLAILPFITAYGTQAITCPLLKRKLIRIHIYNLEMWTPGTWNDLFVTKDIDFTPVCNLRLNSDKCTHDSHLIAPRFPSQHVWTML